MAETADSDLNYFCLQLERTLTELGSLRDDMTVLTSIVLRLDGTTNALLQEVRATHTQIQRMNDGVCKLETQSTTT